MNVNLTKTTPESIRTLVAVLNYKVRALVAEAKKTGMQQTRLASQCHIDPSDMSKFCNGVDMSLNFLGKIIEASGCVVSNISLIPIPAPKPQPKVKIIKARPQEAQKSGMERPDIIATLDNLLKASKDLLEKEQA